jgi:hypothetical protein
MSSSVGLIIALGSVAEAQAVVGEGGSADMDECIHSLDKVWRLDFPDVIADRQRAEKNATCRSIVRQSSQPCAEIHERDNSSIIRDMYRRI